MIKEIIGIVATLFIIFSMSCNTKTRKSTFIMRITNLIGSLIFVVYGFILPAYSTGILNFVLSVVNLYYIIKLIKEK